MAEEKIYVFVFMFQLVINDVIVSRNFDTVKKLWEGHTKKSWDIYEEMDMEERSYYIGEDYDGTTIYETTILS